MCSPTIHGLSMTTTYKTGRPCVCILLLVVSNNIFRIVVAVKQKRTGWIMLSGPREHSYNKSWVGFDQINYEIRMGGIWKLVISKSRKGCTISARQSLSGEGRQQSHR